jgi:hypothetical protein
MACSESQIRIVQSEIKRSVVPPDRRTLAAAIAKTSAAGANGMA